MPADKAATAKRLYETFVAPLVLGGALSPGPAIGAASGLALGGGDAAVDPDVRSRVDVARVRVARRLAPIDVVFEPDDREWSLAAALHDLVHALHPGMARGLHAGAADRLLAQVEQVVRRVQAPESLRAALSRHTYFARVFEIVRTDATVSWWAGTATFLGSKPPPRMLAMPELRRVHVEEAVLSLADLSASLPVMLRPRLQDILSRWLEKTPLTDLATAARTSPPFAWTASSLGLLAARHGRTLGLRALALGPPDDVDAALGRAAMVHVNASAWPNVRRIVDVLADRVIASAAAGVFREGAGVVSDDAIHARALGATRGLARIDTLGLPPAVARRITSALLPLVAGGRGREIAEIARRLG